MTIHTKEVIENDILLKDIYSPKTGALLLKAGAKLNHSLKSCLLGHNITTVVISKRAAA